MPVPISRRYGVCRCGLRSLGESLQELLRAATEATTVCVMVVDPATIAPHLWHFCLEADDVDMCSFKLL